ncbi:GNAT family N-acetyltransferase [Celerinatantimonas sp. YJH-8]|uniref:GNAT family N-acetyltransferase n=1 Tax=Celerinatantimonas sp. YJH-8 TaxID=3228714 RepID=UPI0038CA613A
MEAQFEFSGDEIDLVNVEISGPRLVLRSITASDDRSVFESLTPDIATFMVEKSADHIGQTKDFIQTSRNSMLRKHELVCVITNYRSEFLGCCRLSAHQSAQTLELSLWLKKSAHGHRYGQETAWMLAQWALKNLKFDTLLFPVDKQNIKGCSVAASLGGDITSERQTLSGHGTTLNEVVYCITSKALYEKLSREYVSI